MRIYISVDMEGISGVTRWQDVITSGQDYERARSWMTADVNAAVAGAREAGATEFVVEENHGIEMLCNLLLDEIDPTVDVVRGIPRGGATTAAALDDGFDAVFLIGHHAKAGDRVGFGAHTISYENYREVRLLGRPVSEGEIFAVMAAQVGVPTALIAGDDIVCAEMEQVCPGITSAVVKRALSNTGGWIIPPVRAQELIHKRARKAVKRVRKGAVTTPPLPPRIAMEIELRSPMTAEVRASIAEHHPEFGVKDDRTLMFEHEQMAVAYRMACIAGTLAEKGTVRPY
jgi:D-amino peptidase